MKLIEMGAHNKVVKILDGKPYKIVELSDGPDGLYYSKMDNILVNRDKYYHSMPGSEHYILTDDEEVLDECRTWITEVEEAGENLFNITKKNFYVMRHIEADAKLSKSELDILGKLLPKATVCYTTDNPTGIFNSYESASKVGTPERGYLFHRVDLEPLLREGFEKMFFKSSIDVYILTNNEIVKGDLAEELDKPRTFISTRRKSIGSVKNAEKMGLYFDYDPLTPWPKFASKCPQVEFEPVNISDDGLTVYRKSYKIIQNMSSESYKELLDASSNKAFIELDEKLISEEINHLLIALFNMKESSTIFLDFHNTIYNYFKQKYLLDYSNGLMIEEEYIIQISKKYKEMCDSFGIAEYLTKDYSAFDEAKQKEEEDKIKNIASKIHEFTIQPNVITNRQNKNGVYLVEKKPRLDMKKVK